MDGGARVQSGGRLGSQPGAREEDQCYQEVSRRGNGRIGGSQEARRKEVCKKVGGKRARKSVGRCQAGEEGRARQPGGRPGGRLGAGCAPGVRLVMR
jgi:hypothetical protein